MLTQSSVDAIFGTAQALANRNIALGAVENTPLAALVESSLQSVISFSMLNIVGEDGKPVTGGQPSFVDLLMRGANEPDGIDGVLHDDIMDESVGVVHDAVEFIIRTARDVVNPKVSAIATDVEAALQKHKKDSEQPISVNSVYDPFFWKTESLHDLIDRYAEAREAPVRYNGPAIPFSVDLLTTGLHSLDSDLKFYLNCDLSENGPEVTQDSKAGVPGKADADLKPIQKIWASTFGGGAFETRDVLKGGRDVIDTALVVFFTALRLGDNPPEGTQASASDWRIMCGELQAEAGRVAAQLLKRQANARRLKNLSVVWPLSHTNGSVIKVDGDVYSGFCQIGGSPEVLIGSYFSDKVTDFDKLLTNADHYRSVYMRMQSVLSGKAKAESLTVFINALNAGVTDVINNGLGGLTLPNTNQAELHEKLKAQLGLLTSRDQDDIWGTARRVLCRTVLENTGVEQFLQDIDYHRNERPSFTVREAALMAAFDALARWIAQLITVTAVRS